MQNEELEFWQKSIQSWPVNRGFKDAAISYANILADRGFPIIYEFRHLADRMETRADVLADMLNRQDGFYRTFDIPKRRGGVRSIKAPSPVLRNCQEWILKNILEKVEIHGAAHAYARNRDILSNAAIHIKGSQLLKMDLTDFFPSIMLPRVFSIFRVCGYAPNIAYYLAKLCTLENRLPQGAPTSPYLSNIVLKRLDRRLTALTQKWDLNYTRYADDLAISGNKVTVSLAKAVTKIVQDEGFLINVSKTVFAREGQKKIITGIAITNGYLTLPKAYKRELRQSLHFIKRFGVLEHQEFIENFNPMYLDSVMGKFIHWLRVEPENSFAQAGLQWLRQYDQELT